MTPRRNSRATSARRRLCALAFAGTVASPRAIAHHLGLAGPSLEFGNNAGGSRWFRYQSGTMRVDGEVVGPTLRAGEPMRVQFSAVRDGQRWSGPAVVALRQRGQWSESTSVNVAASPAGSYVAELTPSESGEMDLHVTLRGTPASFTVPLEIPLAWKEPVALVLVTITVVAVGGWSVAERRQRRRASGR
jgi:hypothetical protein